MLSSNGVKLFSVCYYIVSIMITIRPSFILSIFLIVSMINNSHAWWTSPRTSSRVTVYKLVECFCDVVCKERTTCTWNCPNACSNGKRSMIVVKRNGKSKTSNDKKVLILPCKFEGWDVDQSGELNYEEFVFSSHTKKEDHTGRKLFDTIDSDGNGLVSKSEFIAAPVLKEKC